MNFLNMDKEIKNTEYPLNWAKFVISEELFTYKEYRKFEELYLNDPVKFLNVFNKIVHELPTLTTISMFLDVFKYHKNYTEVGDKFGFNYCTVIYHVRRASMLVLASILPYINNPTGDIDRCVAMLKIRNKPKLYRMATNLGVVSIDDFSKYSLVDIVNGSVCPLGRVLLSYLLDIFDEYNICLVYQDVHDISRYVGYDVLKVIKEYNISEEFKNERI